LLLVLIYNVTIMTAAAAAATTATIDFCFIRQIFSRPQLKAGSLESGLW